MEPDLCRLLLKGEGSRAQAGYHRDAGGGGGLCKLPVLRGGARRVLSRDMETADFQPVLLTPVSTCGCLDGTPGARGREGLTAS